MEKKEEKLFKLKKFNRFSHLMDFIIGFYGFKWSIFPFALNDGNEKCADKSYSNTRVKEIRHWTPMKNKNGIAQKKKRTR